MKKPKFFFKMRKYKDRDFVSVWLIKQEGAALSGMLYGEMLESSAREMISASGLDLEEEKKNYSPSFILNPKKRTLFDIPKT